MPDTSLMVKESWKAGIAYGSNIGGSGLIAADIDNDGIIEIIAGGATSTFGLDNFWYILEYSPSTQSYTQKWVSNLYSVGITKIAAFDLDNDGVQTVFLGLSNGTIRIHHGSTLVEIGSINVSANSIKQILWADADNDSIKDLVILDAQKIYIYDSTSLTLKHQLAYGGNDIEIGNVDGDAANEIILSSGKVIQLNGTTSAIEWNYSSGFGDLIELSDIDLDGKAEIIGASAWYYVRAFDADLQSQKWQIKTDQDIDALLVTDVDSDGIDEVIYGDGQWGEVHAYNAVTAQQKWQINNPEHGVTNIAVSDTDGDGKKEILWGAGASSTGKDQLYVHDIATRSREWQSQHIDGPFHAVDIGDVDNDGTQEIVFASFESNSGYSDGVVFVYDAQTHALEWQSSTNLFGGYAWTGIHDLKIGDVDDDGTPEIVVATDRLYDGALYVINGMTKSLEKTYLYDDGAPLYSIDIADVDRDGNTEIIAGGGREHTGAPGVYTYVMNGSTGAVEWHSNNIGDYWSDITTVKVGNLDGDLASEIVAVKNNIYVFDGISHQQQQSALSGVYGLDLYDIDNNGVQEIVAGTVGGNIVILNGQTLQEQFRKTVSSATIEGLEVYDVGQDGKLDVVFTTANAIGIYNLSDSTLLWQSSSIGTGSGRYPVVSNLDTDVADEILVGTAHSVFEFEAYIPPNITLAVQSNAVAENGLSNLVYTFTRDRDLNNPLTVNFTVAGDAIFNTDYTQMGATTYTATTGTITFTAGQNTATLTLNPTGDTVVEPKESINLTLATGTNYNISTPTAITSYITNDDGDANNNLLEGGDGNDNLNGQGGNDTLIGGKGNDIYTIDTLSDVIIEYPNEGTDTLKSPFSTLLSDTLENLILLGNTNLTGTGNIANNSLTGNSGSNVLSGLEGKDNLVGGNGNDTLIGGVGNDTLTGGTGQDYFVFNAPTEGIDRIKDFNLTDDTIYVSAAGFAADLTPSAVLNADQFTIGSGATTLTHRFVYNSSTGALLFDANGNATEGVTQIATLSAGLAMTNTDIFVS